MPNQSERERERVGPGTCSALPALAAQLATFKVFHWHGEAVELQVRVSVEWRPPSRLRGAEWRMWHSALEGRCRPGSIGAIWAIATSLKSPAGASGAETEGDVWAHSQPPAGRSARHLGRRPRRRRRQAPGSARPIVGQARRLICICSLRWAAFTCRNCLTFGSQPLSQGDGRKTGRRTMGELGRPSRRRGVGLAQERRRSAIGAELRSSCRLAPASSSRPPSERTARGLIVT